jgi:hypothetical protein
MRSSDILLPPIPEKLRRIDDSTVGEHFSLDGADRCYYIWEYAARKRYDFSPANQLVFNLKIKPSVLAKAPTRGRYKLEAIAHSGAALRSLITRVFVETRATFVPIPCSKAAPDPDYDDRLARVLANAFQGWEADVRQMLTLTHSTPADHESVDRLTFEELRAITELRSPFGAEPRPVIVIVDDVLNSGKHFKVAQSFIKACYPSAEIRGVFLARCVRQPVEFEVPPE